MRGEGAEFLNLKSQSKTVMKEERREYKRVIGKEEEERKKEKGEKEGGDVPWPRGEKGRRGKRREKKG